MPQHYNASRQRLLCSGQGCYKHDKFDRGRRGNLTRMTNAVAARYTTGCLQKKRRSSIQKENLSNIPIICVAINTKAHRAHCHLFYSQNVSQNQRLARFDTIFLAPSDHKNIKSNASSLCQYKSKRESNNKNAACGGPLRESLGRGAV